MPSHYYDTTPRNLNRASVRCICLEFLSQKFEKDIPKKRSDQRNFKVGNRKDIADGPDESLLLSHAGVLKLPHQKIGIEQEEDKTYLDHRSPDIFLHSRNRQRLEQIEDWQI